MSMKPSASARRSSTVAGASSIFALVRPLNAIVRSSTRRSPASTTYARTVARSAPVAMTSRPRRAPNTNANASTTSDLPAPVSPVNTVSPGPGSITTCRATAKSAISSRSSTLAHRARHLSFEPLGQVRIERLRLTEAHEPRTELALADCDVDARRDGNLFLPIDTHDRAAIARHFELDHGVRLQDEAPSERQVRRDGGHHEVVFSRSEDWPAGTQGVPGAAGRSRDDNAIAAVVREPRAIHPHVDVYRATGQVS